MLQEIRKAVSKYVAKTCNVMQHYFSTILKTRERDVEIVQCRQLSFRIETISIHRDAAKNDIVTITNCHVAGPCDIL